MKENQKQKPNFDDTCQKRLFENTAAVYQLGIKTA